MGEFPMMPSASHRDALSAAQDKRYCTDAIRVPSDALSAAQDKRYCTDAIRVPSGRLVCRTQHALLHVP